MNNHLLSDSLSNILKLHQGPDCALYVEGVNAYKPKFHNICRKPKIPILYGERCQSLPQLPARLLGPLQYLDTRAYDLPGVPFNCTQMPILTNPYGSDDLQVINSRFCYSQLSQLSKKASEQSDGTLLGCLIHSAQRGYSRNPCYSIYIYSYLFIKPHTITLRMAGTHPLPGTDWPEKLTANKQLLDIPTLSIYF